MGLALREQDKLDEAVTIFEKAIELDPNWQDPIENKWEIEQLIQQSQ